MDSYTRVILPPRGTVDKYKSPEFKDKTVIMDKSLSYMEYELQQDKARKLAEAEQESERGIHFQIIMQKNAY